MQSSHERNRVESRSCKKDATLDYFWFNGSSIFVRGNNPQTSRPSFLFTVNVVAYRWITAVSISLACTLIPRRIIYIYIHNILFLLDSLNKIGKKYFSRNETSDQRDHLTFHSSLTLLFAHYTSRNINPITCTRLLLVNFYETNFFRILYKNDYALRLHYIFIRDTFALIEQRTSEQWQKWNGLANDRDETLNRAGKINRNSWRGPKIKASVRLRAWRRTSSSQDRLERGNVVAYVRKRLSFRSPVHWATRIDVSVHRLSVEADITPFAPAKSAYNTFSKKYYIAAPRPCKYSPPLIVFSLDFDPNNPFPIPNSTSSIRLFLTIFFIPD